MPPDPTMTALATTFDATAALADEARADARGHGRLRDRKIEELAHLVTAFSGITDKLQQSHAALTDKVAQLQAELAEKNRLLSDKQRQLERRNRRARSRLKHGCVPG